MLVGTDLPQGLVVEGSATARAPTTAWSFAGPSTPFRPLLHCVVDLDVGWTASFQVNTSGHEAVIRCHTKGRFEIVQSGQICGLRHSVDPW